MTTITEAEVEQAALDWLKGLGWQVADRPRRVLLSALPIQRKGWARVVAARRA